MAVPEIGMQFALGFQLLGGIKSVVSVPIGNQLFGIVSIVRFAFTLAIGAVISTMHGAFIGLDATPLETVLDVILCSGYETGLIGILNPKHECAAILAGK